MNAVDGQESAADALEDPRFLCHLGECDGLRDAFFERQIPAHEKLAEADGENVEEALGGEAGYGEIAIAIGEGASGVEAFAFGEPLEVAALTPEGEVDLGDGRSVELRVEDGLDRGEGVEPGGEFPAWFAFEKAEIELLPDVVREVGDFTVASCHSGGV